MVKGLCQAVCRRVGKHALQQCANALQLVALSQSIVKCSTQLDIAYNRDVAHCQSAE